MKKFLLICFSFLSLMVFLAVGGVAALYYWAIQDLPSFTRIDDYRPALTTTVLAADGSVLGTFYRENRFLISLSEMPKILPQAFLAAEDAEFYQHEGVNPLAIFRAFLVNLQSGSTRQGGSTITQQVIKRLLLTPERSYERKIKEAILAYRLERYLTKDEILTIYLNQIFLGANAYGVEAASRTYFGKHAKDLSIAEAALIAGLPQAPSRYNPYRDEEAAKARQLYVLRRLREINWITEAQYEEALKQPLVYTAMSEGIGPEGAWYLEEVRRQLISLFDEKMATQLNIPLYGEAAVYELGLTVQTPMQPEAQLAANDSLRQGLEKFGRMQGWFHNQEKIDPKDAPDFIAKTKFSPNQLVNGGWVKGLVTKVTEKNVEVRLGQYTGNIAIKEMSWARVPNPRLSTNAVPAIKDATKVVAPFDVIWVALEREPQVPYDPTKITQQTPLKLSLQKRPEVQGALVSLDAKNGDVVAMIGGYDFQSSQFNRATQAKRQPGSSFKPVVYSAALDNGYTPASVILDAPVVEFMENGEIWRPDNYEKSFKGPILLRTALALSRNLCTIRVAQQMGIDKVAQRAKELRLDADFPPYLSISLGAVAVTPINMTQIYTSFANGGIMSKPRFITQIKDFWGGTMFDFTPSQEETLTPQNAYIMASLLKDVIIAGTGGKARVLNRPVAGKTGTTNSENDAWFIGFTPYLVTGIYVGYDQLQPMGRDGSGSTAALPIFVDYSQKILKNYPPDDFVMPEGITITTVDANTGMLPGTNTQKTLSLPFYTGTEPRTQDNGEDLEVKQRGEDLLKELY